MLDVLAKTLASNRLDDAGVLASAYVAARADTAVAWADVGWIALHAGHAALAREWISRAAALDPQGLEPQVLDALCHMAWRDGDLHAAGRVGAQALQRKHERAMAAFAQQPQARPVEAAARAAGTRRFIGLSLFGADAWYGESAVATLSRMRSLYADWQPVVFVDSLVSDPLRQRLADEGAIVREPDASWRGLPGRFWRFAVIDEPSAGLVMLRDVDSPPTAREAAAVAQWVGEGQLAHVMRDHALHGDLVLAGLWGCRAAALKGIGDALAAWFAARPRHPTHADQHFLRDWAWPRIEPDVLQHDSVFAWHGGRDFPQPAAPGEGNVGQSSAVTTTMQLPAHMPEQGTVWWDLTDTRTAQVLARYASPLQHDQWQIRLPPQAAARMKNAELKAVPAAIDHPDR